MRKKLTRSLPKPRRNAPTKSVEPEITISAKDDFWIVSCWFRTGDRNNDLLFLWDFDKVMDAVVFAESLRIELGGKA